MTPQELLLEVFCFVDDELQALGFASKPPASYQR
jgi:hypothetical protein